VGKIGGFPKIPVKTRFSPWLNVWHAVRNSSACSATLRADETCSSPYLARIEGQEEFLYVWTLGVEGMGDGADKLVTIDVKPRSADYGKVIHSIRWAGRHEAHHGGFTDDRRQLWLSGLESSKIFIYDVYTNPAKPRHVKTIDNFEKVTGGAVGPHGVYALPGRVLIPCLSNAKDKGAYGAGRVQQRRRLHRHPLAADEGHAGPGNAEFADGYGYDARVLPRKNVLLTTSFTGWKNYTRPFGELVQDAEAMKQFGNSMVFGISTRASRRRRSTFRARRWKSAGPGARRTITRSPPPRSPRSSGWRYEDKKGEWQAKEVAHIGGEGGVLPVDMSMSADDKTLFVDCFGDGKVRVFDVSNPHRPRQIYEKQIGKQLNMVSQSWDGKRLYFSSSLLARWDKKGDDNDQFVRAYHWNGKELTPPSNWISPRSSWGVRITCCSARRRLATPSCAAK
jgi:methanethiol oxidase